MPFWHCRVNDAAPVCPGCSSGDSGPTFPYPKVGPILIEHDNDSCYFKMLNFYPSPRVMKSMIGVLAGTGEIEINLARVIQVPYTTIT